MIVGWNPLSDNVYKTRRLTRASESKLKEKTQIDTKGYADVMKTIEHHGFTWKSSLAIDTWSNMVIGGSRGKVFFVDMQTREVRMENGLDDDLMGIHVYKGLLLIFQENKPAILVEKDLKLKFTIKENLLTRYSSGYGSYSRGSQVVRTILYFITDTGKQLAVLNLEDTEAKSSAATKNYIAMSVLRNQKNISAFSIFLKGKIQIVYYHRKWHNLQRCEGSSCQM